MRRTAARAAQKIEYKMANQIQLSRLKIGTSRQIVPLIFMWEENGRARSAEIFIWNGQPDSIFIFENLHFLSNRPLIFLWDEKSRAHSAKNISKYNLLSYGFLNRTARAARNIFQYINTLFVWIQMDFLRNQRAAWSKVCVGKMQNPGHPKSLCR